MKTFLNKFLDSNNIELNSHGKSKTRPIVKALLVAGLTISALALTSNEVQAQSASGVCASYTFDGRCLDEDNKVTPIGINQRPSNHHNYGVVAGSGMLKKNNDSNGDLLDSNRKNLETQFGQSQNNNLASMMKEDCVVVMGKQIKVMQDGRVLQENYLQNFCEEPNKNNLGM